MTASDEHEVDGCEGEVHAAPPARTRVRAYCVRAARYSRACSTSASKSAASSPASGCHCTPSGEAEGRILDRLERAVGGPRRLDEAVADPPERLMVVRGHVGAGTDDRRESRAVLDLDRMHGELDREPACARRFRPDSGRCWTRSPPRATFRSWTPRQIASVGMSRSRAACRRASSPASRRVCGVSVSGCASAP